MFNDAPIPSKAKTTRKYEHNIQRNVFSQNKGILANNCILKLVRKKLTKSPVVQY